MHTVGASVVEIGNQFLYQVTQLPPVVAAFVEYDSRRNQITLSTLLDKDDPDIEQELARIELALEQRFEDYPFDFSTVHLRGRNPEQFIPNDAALTFRRPALRRGDAR